MILQKHELERKMA
jgi:uncharacterized cupredoxin-like copper-binding protein